MHIYRVGNVVGRPFCTMEYLEGASLSDQQLELSQSALQTTQAVSTLQMQFDPHIEKGIIHRDLKPTNILLTLEGMHQIATWD